MAFSNFLDKAKASAKEAANKVTETAEQALDLSKEALDFSKEKIRELSSELLAEINGLKPILTECGFVLGDINLTFPFPEVRMTIEQTGQAQRTLEDILAEDLQKSADEAHLSKLQKLILNSMVKANELAQVTGNYGYTFKRYDVTMSTPPRITLHLVSTKVN